MARFRKLSKFFLLEDMLNFTILRYGVEQNCGTYMKDRFRFCVVKIKIEKKIEGSNFDIDLYVAKC